MIPSSACLPWQADQSGYAGDRGGPAPVTPRYGTRPVKILTPIARGQETLDARAVPVVAIYRNEEHSCPDRYRAVQQGSDAMRKLLPFVAMTLVATSAAMAQSMPKPVNA